MCERISQAVALDTLLQRFQLDSSESLVEGDAIFYNRRRVLLRIRFAARVLLALCMTGTALADPMPGREVVEALYRDHHPFDEPTCVDRTCDILISPDRQSLGRYFDEPLTELFLKDHECGMRTREICALDWDPIYNAQDGYPEDSNVKIDQCSPSPALKYCVTTGRVHAKIRYSLTETPSGWKISDIENWKKEDKKWFSLKQIFTSFAAEYGFEPR